MPKSIPFIILICSVLNSQIEILTPSINFGYQNIETITQQSLTIYNPQLYLVQVDSISFLPGPYYTDTIFPIAISGQDSISIPVFFEPFLPGPYDGLAMILSNDSLYYSELLGWTSISLNSLLSEIYQSSDPVDFQNFVDREYKIVIKASTESSWQESDRESNVISVWVNYEPTRRHDAVLFAGVNYFYYPSQLGVINSGDHFITLKYEPDKSSPLTGSIQIESIEIIPLTTIGVKSKVHTYSPILYGRDLFDDYESRRTDIPLIMYPILTETENETEILYRVIFSNEDSRIGLGLSQLMSHYGRTTDIEWIYQITLDENNEIVSEIFQGPSHTTMEFTGEKYNNHPILKNVTANCNFMDNDTSLYRFFPAIYFPVNDVFSGEDVMDEHPWTYRIMTEELYNENKIEMPANYDTYEISDPRNYLYIEYEASGNNIGNQFTIRSTLLNQCTILSNDHYFPEFDLGTGMGRQRTSIELPDSTSPNQIEFIRFHINPVPGIIVNVDYIHALFMLDENYIPIHIPIDAFSGINLNENNPFYDFHLNFDMDSLDCSGFVDGAALCDDCNICTGGTTGIEFNSAIDDCGMCNGENEAMDCIGECFGNAHEDLCGNCDDNESNDNDTCSGCTDENANNYDPFALIDNGSCIYDDGDHVLHVPYEYPFIQTAINFSVDGDTILVQPGIYYENINLSGKQILVSSIYFQTQDSSDLLNTIIDGSGLETVVTFENGETENCILSGFTIQNGFGIGVPFEEFFSIASDEEAYENMLLNEIKAGGISIGQSSPTLSHLIIENNTSFNSAAGIGIVYGNPLIMDCTIKNNSVLTGEAIGGGGLTLNGGTAVIEHTIIMNNTVGTNQLNFAGGGGILVGFTFNELYPSHLTLENVSIKNNSAPIGGGLGALSGEIYLSRSLLVENEASLGGSISLGEPFGLIVDPILLNIIHSNILNPINSPNNIVMGNHCNMLVINSIIRNTDIPSFDPLPNHSELNVHAVYSNISNGWDGLGNINEVPLFNISDSINWFLMEDSPCIDAGIDYYEIAGNVILDIPPDQFAGNAPDMGYLEFGFYSGIPGDLNSDNGVNIIDIVFLVQIILEWFQPTPEQSNAGDLSQNGTIDISDILMIIEIILEN